MSSPILNWALEKNRVSDKDTHALLKAKALEKKRIRDGWRWVRIHDKIKTLVPFENDKPTEHGMRMIERRKELLGIK